MHFFSHCIFSIKTVGINETDNPEQARVTHLSFCDFAGSERWAKTDGYVERLKEAGKINTSLLTLGKCIETLRHNQQHPDNVRVMPYRNSRLTWLFQSFLMGYGRACMIVNVNKCSSVFDENFSVMKFTAIAVENLLMILIRKKTPVINSMIMLPGKKRENKLVGVIDHLQNSLKEEKAKVYITETNLRELLQQMNHQVVNIERKVARLQCRQDVLQNSTKLALEEDELDEKLQTTFKEHAEKVKNLNQIIANLESKLQETQELVKQKDADIKDLEKSRADSLLKVRKYETLHKEHEDGREVIKEQLQQLEEMKQALKQKEAEIEKLMNTTSKENAEKVQNLNQIIANLESKLQETQELVKQKDAGRK
ncbi:uncharacterized protein LOC143461008 isoform X2 [Clavelina lepadiformis]|uniref:uncharacterized protein LOC143461008 isoform X2 n=1 Tax=Clavelina lepadiformis TaxID=159417 RepID=UPI004042ACF4